MCPDCPNCRASGSCVVRNGHFFRQSDSRKIQTFRCRDCGRYFSRATFSECYRQKKRRINEPLRDLLCKRISMRDAARHFRVSRTTIARRLIFLAQQARRRHKALLVEYEQAMGPIKHVQCDDLITAEHTKCKPITCCVVVEEKSRMVMDFCVAQIPAFGLLAKISVEKYGKRADHSQRERHKLFARLSKRLPDDTVFRSDMHSHYPRVIKKHFAGATHITLKGEKKKNAGQGEMKRGRDPLFSINQTFAMCRDKISRLTRLSWNLSKKKERFADHMAIYTESHNRQIWERMQKNMQR